MNTGRSELSVSGIHVDVNRRSIKNIHLSVHPPKGRVTLSVPLKMNDDNARLAVIRRLKWIKQKQNEFHQQQRQSERKYIAGESHFFNGSRYILEVQEADRKETVSVAGNGRLRLTAQADISVEKREQAFNIFYRTHLKSILSDRLDGWCDLIGKQPSDIRIQRMKTRWGSCNPQSGRILLNLELAKKPVKCVEYILVHELVHLHFRKHNHNFVSMLDRVMPDWKIRRDTLTSMPLAYETWSY